MGQVMCPRDHTDSLCTLLSMELLKLHLQLLRESSIDLPIC
jgi:hypothetical protein